MSTLDDKLLGVPSQNYCSDDDDGDEREDEDFGRRGGDGAGSPPDAATAPVPPFARSSTAVNTGPKGVMEDKRLYLEMRRMKIMEERELAIADMKRLSLANPTDIRDEDLFKDYCAKRLEELRHKFDRLPAFGVVSELNADNFTVAIDTEHPDTSLLIHIFVDEQNPACQALTACFNILAKKYLQVKFCKFKPPVGVVSETFRQKGCPAIVAYRGGKLCANLVCLHQSLGEDFYVTDVEKLLLENKMLPRRFHERLFGAGDSDEERAD